MVKPNIFEVPPPGVGVNTVTLTAPGAAMSEAGMVARNWLVPINAVGLLTPFHGTTDPGTKFDPITVRMNWGPPAVALLGLSEEIPGGGLLMVKVWALEVP